MEEREIDLIGKAESVQIAYDRQGSTITDESELLYGILCATTAIARMLYNASPETLKQ